MSPIQPLRILYRNYRGEVAVREITPFAVGFSGTQWHPEPQWILTAYDNDKGETRGFAFKDMLAIGDEAVERVQKLQADQDKTSFVLACVHHLRSLFTTKG